MTSQAEMLHTIRKLQFALEYAKNHAMNPECTDMADLFRDIREALDLAERFSPMNSSQDAA